MTYQIVIRKKDDELGKHIEKFDLNLPRKITEEEQQRLFRTLYPMFGTAKNIIKFTIVESAGVTA